MALLATALEGRYVIEREIGSGGTSVVFRARDLRHQRLVAIKVLRPELARSLGTDRFLREIRIAASLTHPHILPVHDSGGAADDLLYYVMPYVEGESLRSRLIREGALPMDDALRIARETADALSYAHSRGVVHRDIKPGNILLIGGHAVVADFGIATATGIGMDDDTLTSPGLIIGTPAYMSPEQARGELVVDGRSDLYSLGCVLYEMLTGEPPFTGPSAHAVLARHSQDIPEPVRSRRASVPVEVEAAVDRLLEKLPVDRYSTAAQFVAALPADSTEQTEPRRRPSVSLRWSGVAVVMALIAAVVVARQPPKEALDDSLYVVLPFRHRGESAAPLLKGDQCESLLHDALSRWRDVSVVDPLWVSDARARTGDRPLTLETGLAMARVRGAGAMVTGEVWQVGDSVYVRGVLYDVGDNGEAVRQHTVAIAPDLSDANQQFRALAGALLVGGGAVESGSATTYSLSAWKAYERGREALLRWDLPLARSHLAEAVRLDPTYGEANLALATTMSWAGEPAGEWRSYATAAAGRDAVGPGDRARALALLTLAQERYQEACDAYRALVRADSLDFGAWFGLGECLSRDKAVLKDRSSPSGWRFRTSYAEAAGAYRHAVESYPSVHQAVGAFGLARLRAVAFVEPHRFRAGFALPPDSQPFGAFASLLHDTLAFVPYPLAEALAGRGPASPTTTEAAVARNRQLLRGVTAAWLKAFPDSPQALELHAFSLEVAGEIREGPAFSSAMGAILAARRRVRDAGTAFRLATVETRLRLKLGQFTDARRLVDSLLRSGAHGDPNSAAVLASLAALSGRPNLSAGYLAKAEASFEDEQGAPIEVPPGLGEAARRFMAFAAVGAPAESLAASERHTRALASSYVEPARRDAVERAVTEEAEVLAYAGSRLGASPPPRDGRHHLLAVIASAVGGDSAGVRAQLARLRDDRRTAAPGSAALDGTLVESWIALQLGDTAGATASLDMALQAMPTYRTDLLHQPAQAAGLPRAMALRADIAASQGDSALAARWAGPVVTLWSGAEPALSTTVARMRSLAGTAGP
jgi:serine/threonine protein kinase/tetratricopeptide (TPR) repeat protein